MSSIFAFDFDAGPEAAAVTVANSGVTTLGTGTIVYRAASAVAGSAFGIRCTAGGTTAYGRFDIATPVTTLWEQFAIKLVALPAVPVIIAYWIGDATLTTVGTLQLQVDGTIQLRNGTAAVITSVALPVGTQCYVSVKVTANGGAAGHRLKVYTSASAAAVTDATGPATVAVADIRRVQLGLGTNSSEIMDFDRWYGDNSTEPLRPGATALPLTATVSVVPSSGTVPFTVTSTATTDGGTGTAISYTWNWGDGTAPTGPQPSATANHSYTVAGSYTVTLTATNA